MRAVSIAGGLDMDKFVRAAAAEIEAYRVSGGDPGDAFLVMTVRACADEQKENGTEPPREIRSR